MFIYIVNNGLYFMDGAGELVNPYFTSAGGTMTGSLTINSAGA
jgi:hypothetical protein